MPTARPVAVRMLSAKMESSKTWPMSTVIARPTMMEKMLSTSGSPAATSAPNTSTRMTSATGMPIISPRRRSLWLRSWASVYAAAAPVTATSNCGRASASSTTAYTPSMWFMAWSVGVESSTLRSVVWRSSEVRPPRTSAPMPSS